MLQYKTKQISVLCYNYNTNHFIPLLPRVSQTNQPEFVNLCDDSGEKTTVPQKETFSPCNDNVTVPQETEETIVPQKETFSPCTYNDVTDTDGNGDIVYPVLDSSEIHQLANGALTKTFLDAPECINSLSKYSFEFR